MNKISLDSIEKAAKRIAALHFFSNVDTPEDIEWLWSLTEMSDKAATKAYINTDNDLYLWAPFESIPQALELMCELRDSIVREMAQELQ